MRHARLSLDNSTSLGRLGRLDDVDEEDDVNISASVSACEPASAEADEPVAMEMTAAVGTILSANKAAAAHLSSQSPSPPATADDFSAEFMRPVGLSCAASPDPSEAPSASESECADVSMQFTRAVGGIVGRHSTATPASLLSTTPAPTEFHSASVLAAANVSMDLTNVVGGICRSPDPIPGPMDASHANATMEFTRAVGGILSDPLFSPYPSPLPSASPNASPPAAEVFVIEPFHPHTLSMELTRPVGGILTSAFAASAPDASRRHEADGDTGVGYTMELTRAVGGIVSGAFPREAEMQIQAESEVSMDLTKAVGGVLPAAGSGETTMDLTRAVGGIVNADLLPWSAASSGKRGVSMDLTRAVGGIINAHARAPLDVSTRRPGSQHNASSLFPMNGSEDGATTLCFTSVLRNVERKLNMEEGTDDATNVPAKLQQVFSFALPGTWNVTRPLLSIHCRERVLLFSSFLSPLPQHFPANTAEVTMEFTRDVGRILSKSGAEAAAIALAPSAGDEAAGSLTEEMNRKLEAILAGRVEERTMDLPRHDSMSELTRNLVHVIDRIVADPNAALSEEEIGQQLAVSSQTPAAAPKGQEVEEDAEEDENIKQAWLNMSRNAHATASPAALQLNVFRSSSKMARTPQQPEPCPAAVAISLSPIAVSSLTPSVLSFIGRAASF